MELGEALNERLRLQKRMKYAVLLFCAPLLLLVVTSFVTGFLQGLLNTPVPGPLDLVEPPQLQIGAAVAMIPGGWLCVRTDIMRDRAEQRLRDVIVEATRRRTEDADFTERISILTASLEDSQRILAELTEELSYRKEALQEAKAEHDDLKHLASVDGKKAEVIDKVLEDKIVNASTNWMQMLNRQSKRSFIWTGVIGAFVVGYLTNTAFDLTKPYLLGP